MADLAKLDLRQQLAGIMTNYELMGDLIDDGDIKAALDLHRSNLNLCRHFSIMLSMYPYEFHVSLKIGGTV